MIYQIRHLTAYTYESPVLSATLALRLTPRAEKGQHLIAHDVTVSPLPASKVYERDFYGNVVNVVNILEAHRELKVLATMRVEIAHEATLPMPDTPWEGIAQAALTDRDLSSQAPAHFLFGSPRIALSPEITRYVRDSFPAGRGIMEGCREVMTRIKSDFAYKPQATEISTPVTTAFAQRRGVCQDFAHIMIAGLRGLGLPAAYVSGYLRTVPPPGKKRLQGADATHAWVTVWCGPHAGWTGFDPTNAIEIANDHITLAIGRDFSDVSPVYGVFVGSGANKLEVEVDVIPLTPGKTVTAGH